MTYTYIDVAIFLLIIGYLYFSKDTSERNLLRNRTLNTGTTYGFRTDSRKQSVYTEYWYIVDGRKYNRIDGNTDKLLLSNPVAFVGENSLVVYDKLNPGYSTIFIKPKDFLKYGITFPDSLSWVKSYFR